MKSFSPESFDLDFECIDNTAHENIFSVTFNIDGKEEEFPYHAGIGIQNPDNPEYFLQSLALDSKMYVECEDFSTFCKEMGYSSPTENLPNIIENLPKNCENLENVLGNDLDEFIKIFYENEAQDEKEIKSFLDKFSFKFTYIDSDENLKNYDVSIAYNGKSFECQYFAGELINEEDFPRTLLESLAFEYYDYAIVCEKDIHKFCSEFDYNDEAYETWKTLQENYEKLGNLFSEKDKKIFIELYSLDPLPFSMEDNDVSSVAEYKKFINDLPVSDEAKKVLRENIGNFVKKENSDCFAPA